MRELPRFPSTPAPSRGQEDPDHEDRAAILARRAAFVAAAIAALGAAACGETRAPHQVALVDAPDARATIPVPVIDPDSALAPAPPAPKLDASSTGLGPRNTEDDLDAGGRDAARKSRSKGPVRVERDASAVPRPCLSLATPQLLAPNEEDESR